MVTAGFIFVQFLNGLGIFMFSLIKCVHLILKPVFLPPDSVAGGQQPSEPQHGGDPFGHASPAAKAGQGLHPVRAGQAARVPTRVVRGRRPDAYPAQNSPFTVRAHPQPAGDHLGPAGDAGHCGGRGSGGGGRSCHPATLGLGIKTKPCISFTTSNRRIIITGPSTSRQEALLFLLHFPFWAKPHVDLFCHRLVMYMEPEQGS